MIGAIAGDIIGLVCCPRYSEVMESVTKRDKEFSKSKLLA